MSHCPAHAAARAIDGIVDGLALDVLRTASAPGYVLTGPHNRICRRVAGALHPEVEDIGRHEQDTVQALLVAGLLDLGHRAGVLDRDGSVQRTRAGWAIVLTRHGRDALPAGGGGR